MPQIWLTYDELAALMDCNPADARRAALAIRLDRRKSRDGQTRVKLTPSLADALLTACCGNASSKKSRPAPAICGRCANAWQRAPPSPHRKLVRPLRAKIRRPLAGLAHPSRGLLFVLVRFGAGLLAIIR